MLIKIHIFQKFWKIPKGYKVKTTQKSHKDNVKENFRNEFKARNLVCMEESAVDTHISVWKTSVCVCVGEIKENAHASNYEIVSG